MYVFKAKVIAGQGQGRIIGFRTANLDRLDLDLAYGVYAVKVTLGGKVFSGLMHFGPKKTFNSDITCEIYLKDFSGDIYGRELEVEVGKKLREIKKFKDAAELKKQLEKDLRKLGENN